MARFGGLAGSAGRKAVGRWRAGTHACPERAGRAGGCSGGGGSWSTCSSRRGRPRAGRESSRRERRPSAEPRARRAGRLRRRSRRRPRRAAALAPSSGPFAELAALDRLRWSSRQASQTITRYVASVRGSLGLTPSDLCGDAQALAASNAQVTPTGTLKRLATFGRTQTAAQNATAAFARVLARYQTQADRSLIEANNRLVNHFNSAVTSLVTAEEAKLLSALGLSA